MSGSLLAVSKSQMLETDLILVALFMDWIVWIQYLPINGLKRVVTP